MKKYSFIVLYFIALQASAQNSNLLKGSFGIAKETEIRLMGYTGTKDTLLAQTKTDALGCQLAHPEHQIKTGLNCSLKEIIFQKMF